jgi:hypothetical protein
MSLNYVLSKQIVSQGMNKEITCWIWAAGVIPKVEFRVFTLLCKNLCREICFLLLYFQVAFISHQGFVTKSTE